VPRLGLKKIKKIKIGKKKRIREKGKPCKKAGLHTEDQFLKK
jgi:hypothetical protein